MKLSIIGVGKIGGALAIALARKNYDIENLISRNRENSQKIAGFVNANWMDFTAEEISKIESDTIIISVQDSNIETVARDLARNLKHQPIVFHTSGALSSDILKSLRKIGCKTGSIHPLVSISDSILGASRFEDVFYCIEGDAEACESAKKIVGDLGGKPFEIEPQFKTLYHASAVTACGHLVALIDVAVEMLSKCGLDETNSKEILSPLIESTLLNLKTQTTAEALTGTFARADVETFEKHLQTLKKNVSGDALETYLQLGMRSVHLAEVQGADRDKLEILQKKISLAKKNLKC
jgi:predicted short-subunit dehydrogenase-like oxidoreductase (DUF2520 family)